MLDLEIIEVRRPKVGGEWGNLRALVDLRINNLIIKNFRVIQQVGQRAYVGVPQTFYIQNGQKLFIPLVFFVNKEDLERVKEFILENFDSWEGNEADGECENSVKQVI